MSSSTGTSNNHEFTSKSDIKVSFPFTPYEVQKDYINAVHSALNNKFNAILESPTGTGKTLCLLTACFSWKNHVDAQENLNSPNQFSGKIIYASRTHSQLSQAVKELRKCYLQDINYSKITSSVLASRQHMCINKKVINESKGNSGTLMALCKKHVKNNTCYYKNQVNNYVESCIIQRGYSKGSESVAPVNANDPQNSQNPVPGAGTVPGTKEAVEKAKSASFIRTQTDNAESTVNRTKLLNSYIPDIEDLHNNSACPYYLTQDLMNYSDIIFLPYNYILDTKIIDSMKLNSLLKNSIIILDEAHNINNICEDLAGFSLSSLMISQCIERVSAILKCLAATQKGGSLPYEWESILDGDSKTLFEDLNIDSVAKLLENLHFVEEFLQETVETPTPKSPHFIKNMETGKLFKSDFIFEIFKDFVDLQFTLINIIDLFKIAFGDSATSPWRKIDGLETLGKVISCLKGMQNSQKLGGNAKSQLIFEQGASAFENYQIDADKFRVYLEVEKEDSSSKKGSSSKNFDPNAIILHFWCFSAGVAMSNLYNSFQPHSIIVTSGTLSPIDSFVSELGIPVGVKLENPHIVSKDNILVGVVKKGPNNVQLNSSYANRNNDDIKHELISSLQKVSLKVPSGMLVFHPSYSHMFQTQKFLDLSLPIKNNFKKMLIYESKQKDTQDKNMLEFYRKVDDFKNPGACLFAVCRGKVSEGIDFSDHRGRMVCLVGIPFPPIADPKTLIKQEFLDQMKKLNGGSSLSGQEWYKQSAMRSVNQAIGRVLRHKNDFGVILLMDNRYAYSSNQMYLSKWVKNYLKEFDNFQACYNSVENFFEKNLYRNQDGAGKFIKPVVKKTEFLTLKKSVKRGFLATSSPKISSNRHLNDIKKQKILLDESLRSHSD